MAVRWRARIVWEFICPTCGQTLTEGNPIACPHQVGPPLYHQADPQSYETMVEAKRPPKVLTSEELAKAMDGCLKGG